ncbi:MAG: thiamine phosphate synthase [bacterium]
MKIYRLIDANLNRAAEGLRVLEDLARFNLEAKNLTERLKALRHAVRKDLALLQTSCLRERDSLSDTGFALSQESSLDDKENIEQVITANCKRVAEALRVIEEMLKAAGYYDLSKRYEQHRFFAYALEKEFYLHSQDKMRNFTTDLYCLTGEEFSLGRSNQEVVEQMIKAGVKIIQYREKEKKMLAKYRECLLLREMTAAAGVTFIINDDVHLALAVEADGVHIGQDDLPVEKVRDILGFDKIIGLSTHSKEQADEAVRCGADYIGVGPVFSTQTKKDVCAAVGFSYLDYVVKNIPIPFVAIGGIKEHNIREVREHGAGLIALVTEIVGADNIEDKIKNLRRRLNE